MTGALVETADAWELPLVGLTVSQLQIDYAFALVLAGSPGGSFSCQVECPFVLVRPGRGEERIEPAADPAGLGPALAVLRRDVTRATAARSGELEIVLSEEMTLRVPPSDDYEAWNVVGPHGLRVVCMPGGELAIRKPRIE